VAPAPSGGTAVPKVVRGTARPVPTVKAAAARIGGSVAYSDGVRLRVTKTTRGVENGKGPGVFPGRTYVLFDLELVNGARTDLRLDQVVVTALAGRPPVPVTSTYIASAKPSDFSGTVRPGASARARYAFAMNPGPKDPVTVVVDFDGIHTSATFSGPLTS
jgi:hypothetical protein